MAHMGAVVGFSIALSLAGSSSAWALQPEGVDETDGSDPTLAAGVDFSASGSTDEAATADASADETASDDSSGVVADFDSSAQADADADSAGSFEADSSASTEAAAPDDGGGALAPAVDAGTGIDAFKGRIALGAIRTIAGLNGINFRYFVTDNLSVGASAGVALFAYKEDEPGSPDPCPGDSCTFENDRTVAAMAFNAEVLYFAKLGREAGQLPFRADFGLGGRFGIISAVNANDAPDNLDDPLEMHIEIPLVFQLMFGNNFSLSPELGMDFRIVPGSREAGDTNPGTGFPGGIGGASGPGFGWEITPGVGLFAGASMHYIFGGR
ncbi:MAG: hypothetical protein AAF721_22385 [Myxococcota bacterium]